MSWDIFVQDIPNSVGSVNEIPSDFIPKSIGLRSDLIRRIRQVVPSVRFETLHWGCIDDPNCSLDINLGDRDEVLSFAFHVYGGDYAPFVVGEILRYLNLRALDPASLTGIFGTDAGFAAAFQRWKTYRAQAIGNGETGGSV
jgi:hypothetical protein